VKKAEDLGSPDMIIIPGSKNTIGDRLFLKETGFDKKIIEAEENGTWIVGICGGYQLLGKMIFDPHKTESDLLEIPGLGLLDITTTFDTEKITTQVKGKVVKDEGLLKGCKDESFYGYEIHMGTTEFGTEKVNPFLIENRFGESTNVIDGVINAKGKVFGTYIHGIFDADSLRRKMLNNLRIEKGWEEIKETKVNYNLDKEKAFNELADVVRNSFDMEKVYRIMGLK